MRHPRFSDSWLLLLPAAFAHGDNLTLARLVLRQPRRLLAAADHRDADTWVGRLLEAARQG